MIEHTPFPWHYANFQPSELASPDTGQTLMDRAFMDRLQHLRSDWGKPIFVTSGYRTAAHNKAVGGSERSAHLIGRAVDIVMTPDAMPDFIVAARENGFTGFGVGKSWLHIDDLDGSDRVRPGMWVYG